MTKNKLNTVLSEIYQIYGQAKTAEIADQLKFIGLNMQPGQAYLGMDDFRDVRD